MIEKLISPLIEQQFPSFYLSDGPAFVTFVKAYYEWLEQGGSESREILNYRNIDDTVDAFLDDFKYEYMSGLPAVTEANRAFIIKHIQDLYKAKGSTQAYKLLFQLVFGEDVDVYDPSVDILRASDGVWTIPRYLECSVSNRTVSFIGKQITGSTSGAKAFVENVVRRKIKDRFIDIVFISNIQGNFSTGEHITSDNSLIESPYIVGSLNNIEITSGGANNKVGDIFTITSEFGQEATAKVTSTVDGTGKVDFTLSDGGYGFSNTANVIVSTAVLFTSNKTGDFPPLSNIIQPLDKQVYNVLAGANSFSVMSIIIGSNATANVAAGYVVYSDTANTTSGNVVISTTSGDWTKATKLTLASNTAITANLLYTVNVSSTATVVDSNAVAVGVYNVAGTLYSNAHIKSFIAEPVGLAQGNTSTNIVTGNNTHFSAIVSNGDMLYFRANSGVFGTVANVNSNTSIALVSNSTYVFSNTTIWHTKYIGAANNGTVYNSGFGATFKVGSLSNTEFITINSDVIGSNNTGDICFLDMLINGGGSNVASNAYGFAANSTIGYSDKIFHAFSNTTIKIGTIKALTSINPGNNYNVNPFVLVRERYVAGYDKKDLNIELSNTNYNFSVGHQLRQDQTIPEGIIHFSSNVGAFESGEYVTQQTSGANGVVISTTSNSITVNIISGTFVAGNNVIGQITGANAAVSNVVSATGFVTADGYIRGVSGNTLFVEQTSFDYSFKSGNVYSIDNNGAIEGLGVARGFTSNTSYAQIGFNAVVNTAVKTAVGIATTLEVLNSGYGYMPNETLTMISQNTSISNIYGNAGVYRQGSGIGFWKNNNGKLNSDKYIHDNYYYQEYSYEIRSRMSINTYSDILKKVLHVSGNELFGGVMIKTEQDVTLDTPGFTITTS